MGDQKRDPKQERDPFSIKQDGPRIPKSELTWEGDGIPADPFDVPPEKKTPRREETCQYLM